MSRGLYFYRIRHCCVVSFFTYLSALAGLAVSAFYESCARTECPAPRRLCVTLYTRRLFVCLLATLHQTTDRFLVKIYLRTRKKSDSVLEVIRIWIWIYEFSEEFFNIADSALFGTLTRISGQTDRMFNADLPLDKKVPLNFESHLYPDSRLHWIHIYGI